LASSPHTVPAVAQRLAQEWRQAAAAAASIHSSNQHWKVLKKVIEHNYYNVIGERILF
jgi:hypothetical protein